MLKRLPFVLARAHLRKRRTQNTVTLLGIAIGVMVLTTSLSLVNGFTDALLQTTLKATPHLLLRSYTDTPSPALERTLARDPVVSAWAPYLEDKGLLILPARGGRAAASTFVSLFGVTPEAARIFSLSGEEQRLLETLQPGEIVLGRGVADAVGAFRGDALNLLNAEQRRLRLTLRGTFRSGNALIDQVYGFVRLETLRTVNTRALSGYQVRLQDPGQAARAAFQYGGSDFRAITWQDYNQTTIQQLNLQKLVIAIIVFLIVVVAAFGIANVLLLSVYERTEEIAILRAMGTARRTLIATFVLEGLVLGVGGLLLGNLLGLGLSYYFYLRPFPLPGDLYFISALPTRIEPLDFVWVNLLSLGVTLLAAYVPARRAAGVEPARVIR